MDLDDSIDKDDGGLSWPVIGPPKGSMARAVLLSGAWLLGLRLGERCLGLVRMVVLARLLAPSDFGLFGIALLALSIVNALSRTGFEEAMIQQSNEITEYLGTAQLTQVLRGIVMTAVLFLIAPGVATFFDEPSARPLLQLLSANMAIVGLANVAVVVFQKQLVFRQFAIVSVSGTLVDFVVSVVAAFVLRDAWALVYGVLAGNLARLLVSYVVARPVRPRFDLQRFRELAGFGGWMWDANIIHLLLNEGDDIIVGRMLGANALGTYRMAFVYASLPATEISHVISRVTFPAYAKLQADTESLRKGYLRTLRGTALASAPLAGGIVVMAPSFVRLILEAPWEPIIVPLQILAVWGFIRALGATTGPVFYGVGHPQIVVRLLLVKLLVLVALIFPLTSRYGLVATSLAVTLAAVINFPLASRAVMRLLRCGARDYIGAWLHPVLATIAMVAALAGWHRWVGPEFGLSVFFVSIVAGVAIYATLVFGVGRMLGYDPFSGNTWP